jgi:hypothetical protein
VDVNTWVAGLWSLKLPAAGDCQTVSVHCCLQDCCLVWSVCCGWPCSAAAAAFTSWPYLAGRHLKAQELALPHGIICHRVLHCSLFAACGSSRLFSCELLLKGLGGNGLCFKILTHQHNHFLCIAKGHAAPLRSQAAQVCMKQMRPEHKHMLRLVLCCAWFCVLPTLQVYHVVTGRLVFND